MDSRQANRTTHLSFLMLAGVPVGIAFLVLWATFVKTSPTLSDTERIRGWGTVVRELPATLFLFMVPFVGLVLAVRAGQLGSKSLALRAIWLHTVALFFILLIVFGGSAENVMTTRPATVKWLLFPVEIAIAVGSHLFCRRMVMHQDNTSRSSSLK